MEVTRKIAPMMILHLNGTAATTDLSRPNTTVQHVIMARSALVNPISFTK